MADIVSVPELKSYLGDAGAGDDPLLAQLLDDVEALFEVQTGHAVGYYRAAATARTEVKDGTGSYMLVLDYPVAAVTSVKLGYDSAAPDETLTVANKKVITFGVGSRALSRTDGGRFGSAGQPRYVEVVYDHQADLPEGAELAIKSVCATAYRRRGSEEVKSESVGAFYSRSMIDDVAATDPFWKMAVEANRNPVFA